MLLNNMPILAEGVEDGFYCFSFEGNRTAMLPGVPFQVETDEGNLIHVVKEYTVPVSCTYYYETNSTKFIFAENEHVTARRELEAKVLELETERSALFELWVSGKKYKLGDVVLHLGKLYKCLQTHTSQDDWGPQNSPSLWRRAADPPEEPGGYEEWIQPAGAGAEYKKGARVAHNGFNWESSVDNNVWEPGVYGWTKIT